MNFNFLKHKHCSSEQLLEICRLKNQHWKYTIDKQYEWINEFIKDEDIHLFLKKEDKLIGYLTLVSVIVKKDNNVEDLMLGVGSVCIDKMFLGQSYGILLMKLVDYYLDSKNKKGILLCKESLSKFYKKCNWTLYDNLIEFNGSSFEDLVFMTEKISSKKITISKLF